MKGENQILSDLTSDNEQENDDPISQLSIQMNVPMTGHINLSAAMKRFLIMLYRRLSRNRENELTSENENYCFF